MSLPIFVFRLFGFLIVQSLLPTSVIPRSAVIAFCLALSISAYNLVGQDNGPLYLLLVQNLDNKSTFLNQTNDTTLLVNEVLFGVFFGVVSSASMWVTFIFGRWFSSLLDIRLIFEPINKRYNLLEIILCLFAVQLIFESEVITHLVKLFCSPANTVITANYLIQFISRIFYLTFVISVPLFIVYYLLLFIALLLKRLCSVFVDQTLLYSPFYICLIFALTLAVRPFLPSIQLEMNEEISRAVKFQAEK